MGVIHPPIEFLIFIPEKDRLHANAGYHRNQQRLNSHAIWGLYIDMLSSLRYERKCEAQFLGLPAALVLCHKASYVRLVIKYTQMRCLILNCLGLSWVACIVRERFPSGFLDMKYQTCFCMKLLTIIQISCCIRRFLLWWVCVWRLWMQPLAGAHELKFGAQSGSSLSISCSRHETRSGHETRD